MRYGKLWDAISFPGATGVWSAPLERDSENRDNSREGEPIFKKEWDARRCFSLEFKQKDVDGGDYRDIDHVRSHSERSSRTSIIDNDCTQP